MKKYKCIKVVEAEPMTYHDAGSLGLVRDYEPDAENQPGFRVKYSDNYESWSPYAAFVNGYKELSNENMTFSEAIEALKQGKKVARKGWNGKGMWLIYVPGNEVEIRENTPYWNAGLRGKIRIDGHIDMYTAQGTLQPGWLASQTDMTAEDWMIVE